MPGCDFRFFLLPVTIRSEPPRTRFVGDPENPGQSFLFDPVRAIEAVRTRRAETARLNLFCKDGVCQGYGWLKEARFLESVVNEHDLRLPTGWYMPPTTIARLAAVVAPDPTADLEDHRYHPSSQDDAEQWQADILGEMADNPGSVSQIVMALDSCQPWLPRRPRFPGEPPLMPAGMPPDPAEPCRIPTESRIQQDH